MKANLLLLVIGLFFGTGAGFLLGQTVERPEGHDHAAHGEPHDDDGPITSHDHSALMETDAASVRVAVTPDGPGALNVHIMPDGMRFAPEAPGQVSLASRVWPSTKLKLKASFLELCKETFGAVPESLDFGDSKGARRRVNEWVSKKTNKLIPAPLPAGALDSSTELVLTNALYFKAQWESAFDPAHTRPGPFHTPSGKIEVPMMHGQLEGLFHQTSEMTAVSLAYKGGPFAMLFVAPKNGLAECKTKLGKSLLSTVERNAMGGGGKVSVTVPKFTISQVSDPLPTLRAMGMGQLLGGNPDFSRLAENPGGLRVDKCFHQAVVEVDESGTKAAAATAVVMVRSPMPSIVLDRPFFFVLYHRSTLAPLFIGQVVDPTK